MDKPGHIAQAFRDAVGTRIINWLLKPRVLMPEPFTDFSRMRQELKPADVILVEGQTQVGMIIQIVTHSRWSHSALCVGRPANFQQYLPDDFDRSSLDSDTPYLVEAELGKGTVLTPIDEYEHYRTRVCRPTGIANSDQEKVVCYTTRRLGVSYNVRQLADLARFMFPYGVLPRKWRSSLFQHNAGPETKIVCSTLIADAFQAVRFPVLPILSSTEEGGERLFKRNSRLFAPSDFDISPYFSVVKFPRYSWDKHHYYHHMPWARDERPAEPSTEMDPKYHRAPETGTDANLEELKS